MFPLREKSRPYQERYLYDSADGRVITRAMGPGGTTSDLYYFASYEARKVGADATGDYACAAGGCARGYLMANGARVAHLDIEPAGTGLSWSGVGDARVHVMLEVADYLGSTNIVVDRDTSELVEWASYSAMGGTEGEYRSARWKGWREEYGFRGKEEARGLGITYFGARWLIPELGRWASADPLTVHGGGADLNGCAYVHGSVLRAVDPVGLDECAGLDCGGTDAKGGVTGNEPLSKAGDAGESEGAKAGKIYGEVRQSMDFLFTPRDQRGTTMWDVSSPEERAQWVAKWDTALASAPGVPHYDNPGSPTGLVGARPSVSRLERDA
jgi:RHS repeat-associated protein